MTKTILVLGCVLSAAIANASTWLDHLELQGSTKLFTGPSLTAHQPFDTIIDDAQKSVLMEMYHLTDHAVAQSLENAKARGIDVTVILDQGGLKSGGEAAIQKELASDQINTVSSSPAFSITHTKSVVVDGKRAIVSSMNLTDHPEVRRDYGVTIEDPGVIQEMESVFNTDIANAQNQAAETPQLSDPHLLWSPINSSQKLHDLIVSAQNSIVAVAENVLDTSIINDLIAAEARGVQVRVLSPACAMGGNPSGNYQASQKLAAGGVHARQMPSPATAQTPYLHGKMMVIDNARAYIGSINYSYNSLHRARELGIALSDTAVIKGLAKSFEDDFAAAKDLGAQVPVCSGAL